MTEGRLQKIHCSGRCTSNYRRNGALYGNGYKNTTEKEECTTKMIKVRCLHQESTGGFNKKQPKETSVLADASHFKLFTYSHLVWSRGNMCDQVVFWNKLRHNHEIHRTVQTENNAEFERNDTTIFCSTRYVNRWPATTKGKFPATCNNLRDFARSKNTESNLILFCYSGAQLQKKYLTLRWLVHFSKFRLFALWWGTVAHATRHLFQFGLDGCEKLT